MGHIGKAKKTEKKGVKNENIYFNIYYIIVYNFIRGYMERKKMNIPDKLFNDNRLSLENKILLAYILKGNHRFKYVSREKVASSILFCSPAKATQNFKQLCDLNLIRWVKKENDRYKIVIVCQESFNRYCDIYDKNDINENCPVKDNYILALGMQEQNKWLKISNNEKGKRLQEAFDKIYKRT